ncbi:beta-propeller domain-containing protein [Kaarinaea lacus]
MKAINYPFKCNSSSSRYLLIILLTLVLLGCNHGSNPPEVINTPQGQTLPIGLLQLQQADNCDELKNYIIESLIKQYASIPKYAEYYYCPTPSPGGGSGDAGTAPPPSTASPVTGDGTNLSGGGESAADGAAPGDVSDTNNQEQGVNESDIVKADGLGNVYILTGRHFIIADGFPPQNMSEHARIDLGARGLNLFLDKENQRVIILAREDQPYYIANPVPANEASTVVYPEPQQDYTVAIFYDVSDPTNPVVIDQLQLRGYFREGRRIDNRLHLVSNHYLRPTGLYEDVQFWELYNVFYNAVYQTRCEDPNADLSTHPAVVAARSNLINKITDVVSSQDPSAYLPDAFRVADGNAQAVPYLACTDIQFPEVNMSLGLQIITSVDTDGANLTAAGIVNNSYITYVSQDNLYLAETSRNWWWVMEDGSWPMSQTAIYKFAISGSAPQYVATGRVDGYVNNQFSLSEYNGALRVATTQDDTYPVASGQWQRIQKNHVSVLMDDGNGALNIVGEVRDFAPDESIRSTRFIGDKGFVVTFRNVDPLFTFNLADPANPVMLGELTIPGFSTYMHPYDENHLLTIGRAGGTGGTGVGNGIQLQLIDISDMANPRVQHSYTPAMPSGWSWSTAEHDHKAFTFYQPANLLAIPLQYSNYQSNEAFSGIAAYEVTLENGFHELGRVDHADLAYDYYCVNNVDVLVDNYSSECTNSGYLYWAAPRRSIVMTDVDDIYLYTLSDVGLKASSINDLSTTLGSLVFPTQPYPWWYFGYIDVGVVEPVPLVSGGVAVGGAEPVPPTVQ